MTDRDATWGAVETTLRVIAERIRPHLSGGWAISAPLRDRRRGDAPGGYLDIARRDGNYEHWSFAFKVWVEIDEPGCLDLRAQLERTNGDELWNLRHVARGEINVEASLDEFLTEVAEDWTFWVDLIDGLPPIG